MAKVSVVQMNSQDDIKANLNTVAKLLEQAKVAGAQLVVLPENFAFMGEDHQKLSVAEKLGSGKIQDEVANLAAKHKIWIIAGTIPILATAQGKSSKFYAASMLYNDSGEMVCRYDKIHLCDVTISEKESYCESNNILPGNTPKIYKTPFCTIGFSICYDIRFPELFRIYSKLGVDIISMPAAFVYETGRVHWQVLNQARAIENLAYVLAADQDGYHPQNRRTFGHSMIVDPWGTIIAEQQSQPGVITAELDFATMHKLRSSFPVIAHRKL